MKLKKETIEKIKKEKIPFSSEKIIIKTINNKKAYFLLDDDGFFWKIEEKGIDFS